MGYHDSQWSRLSYVVFGEHYETNARLAGINAQLQQQNEALRQAKAETDRVQFCRDMVFSMKKGLEEVYPLISSQPAYSYYQASSYLRNLQENNISESSFSDFTDKEYTLKVLSIGNDIKRDSSSSLSSEQIQNLDYFLRLEYILPHYARIANWHKIHNLLPYFDLPINWLTIFLMLLFSSFSPLLHIAIILTACLSWIKKSSVMPEVKRLAKETGGYATGKIRRGDCKIIIAQLEKTIQQLGFPLESTPDRYLAKIKEVKEQMLELIDELQLPLELN